MKKSGGGGARDKSPPPRIDSPVKEREEEEIKNMKNKLGLQDDSQIQQDDKMNDSQLPTDKDQLIAYLTARLEKTEKALDSADEVIESERNQRLVLQQQIEQKNKEILKQIERDQQQIGIEVDRQINRTVQQAMQVKKNTEQRLEQLSRQIQTMGPQTQNTMKEIQEQYKQTNQAHFQYDPIALQIGGVQEQINKKQQFKAQLEEQGKLLDKQTQYLNQQSQQVQEALKKFSEVDSVFRKVANPKSYKQILIKSEGKTLPQFDQISPMPSAVRMSQNNRDYFYEGEQDFTNYRPDQLNKNDADDDFWGVGNADNQAFDNQNGFVKNSLAKGIIPGVTRASPKLVSNKIGGIGMNRGGGGGLGVGQRGAGNYQKSTSKRVQGQPTLRGATKGGKKY